MMPREELLVLSVEPRARAPMASECTVADPLVTVVVHSLVWPVSMPTVLSRLVDDAYDVVSFSVINTASVSVREAVQLSQVCIPTKGISLIIADLLKFERDTP